MTAGLDAVQARIGPRFAQSEQRQLMRCSSVPLSARMAGNSPSGQVGDPLRDAVLAGRSQMGYGA